VGPLHRPCVSVQPDDGVRVCRCAVARPDHHKIVCESVGRTAERL
jgi:hypothetical protein